MSRAEQNAVCRVLRAADVSDAKALAFVRSVGADVVFAMSFGSIRVAVVS